MDKLSGEFKVVLLAVLVLFFAAAGAAGLIDLLSGTISEVFLDSTALSGSWVGVSGNVNQDIGFTDESIGSFVSNSGNSGEVLSLDLDGGQTGDNAVIAVVPFIDNNLDPSGLGDMSQSELESQEPLPENYFPSMYNGLGYEDSSDSVLETFDQEGSITLFETDYDTVVSTTQNNIDVHMLKYDSLEEGEIPAFFVDSDSYDECFDGGSCNYQFILPSLEDSTGGDRYNIFLASKTDPVDITTFINGEPSTEFESVAQPYSLTVETEAVFGGQPVDQTTRVVEREGNNLFIPAIGSTGYESEAFTEFTPENGEFELLVVPTKSSTPDYNMQVRAFSDAGDIAGRQNLTVDSESVPANPTSAEQLQLLDDFLSEYNQGVNALRPIANCVFEYASEDNIFYRLDIDSSTDSLTLSPGVPYIVDVDGGSVANYQIKEPGSRLVFLPSLTDEFGERDHRASEQGVFSSDEEVVFTPTVNNLNDEELEIELGDAQGGTVNTVDINAAQSVCGEPDNGDGSSTSSGPTSDLTTRVNAVRPILNSMFEAGN